MKHIIPILIFLFTIQHSFAQSNVMDSVLHQVKWRTFKIHLPPTYDGVTPLPLVVALHGGGHDADTMEYISQLSAKADLENFIVVYPNGRKFVTRTWNAGNCCGAAANLNIDDVGFIVKMMDSLESKYSIDTNSVYLTGASNGGMLAYRIACEQPQLFAAVAPVATTMVTSDPCSPSQEVPILHIHSSLDTHVPLSGGFGSGPSGAYMPPNDSIINVWRQNNNCTGTRDTIYNQLGTVGVEWTNCSNCSELLVYITSDGGHSWPGGKQTVNGDIPSQQLNATDLIWSFFSNHSLDCSPLSVKKYESNVHVTISPNPTKNFVKVFIDKNNGVPDKMKLLSITGKVIKETTSNTFDLSNCEKGIYFVWIELGKSNVIKKIIKN